MEWSYSSLSTGQQCWEKFRRRYIEGERRPPNARMARGKATDKVANESHIRQMRGREERGLAALIEDLPSPEEAGDMAATEFDAVAASGLWETPDDLEVGPSVARGRAKDDAVALSRLYVASVAPEVDPVAVQHKTTIKLPHTDVGLVGVVDLIDGARGLEVVADNKTTDKSPSAGLADVSDQLTMYSLLRLAEVGRMPDKVRLDYLVRTPSGTERHVRLESKRTAAHLRALVDRLNTAVELVSKGVFPPTNSTDWSCDPRWCEYFNDCRYTAGRR